MSVQIRVPEVPSFLGYGVLARNLASHGYVVVSIGANGFAAREVRLLRPYVKGETL